jgi:general secretion pathway protein D
LRLKNGETQILAGLIRNDHSANADQIPGLGQVPVVGRLFGQHDDTWKKRELVLSITPRIVRNLPYMPPDQLEYTSGTEANLRARPLSLQDNGGAVAGEPVKLTAPPGQPAPAAAARPGAPAAAASPGAAAPAGAPTVVATANALQLNFQGPSQLKVGEEATLTLNMKADQPLVSTALQIGFDPKAVKIVEVSEGQLMRQDGGETTFSARTDEAAGRIFVGIARPNGTGATGDGPLVQLRVTGVAPAPASPLSLVVFSGIGPGNKIQSAALPPALPLAVEP